jgi:hypothetical protein
VVGHPRDALDCRVVLRNLLRLLRRQVPHLCLAVATAAERLLWKCFRGELFLVLQSQGMRDKVVVQVVVHLYSLTAQLTRIPSSLKVQQSTGASCFSIAFACFVLCVLFCVLRRGERVVE